MSETEDALTKECVTYPIDVAAATTTVVRAVGAGHRWHLMGFYIRAEGHETMTFLSAATPITGPVDLDDTNVFHLPIGKVPHMSGRATGENFSIITGVGAQISGWATIAEEK